MAVKTSIAAGGLRAAVIGSGPNGLAAAITLQQAGFSVEIFEALGEAGGAVSSAEITLPGFVHDLGSAIHPLGPASPFFKSLPLEDHGLRWITPPACVAHPLPDGPAVIMYRDLVQTSEALEADGKTYRRLYFPLVECWDKIITEILGPIGLPLHPIAMAEFGLRAMLPAEVLAKILFKTPQARSLLAGLFAHSNLPFNRLFSSAPGLVLGAAGHVVGWPFPEGGAKNLARALVSYFESIGGKVTTNHRVEDLRELLSFDLLMCDVTPRQFSKIGAASLPAQFLGQMNRYHYGPGSFKIDWALSDPIPWRNPECALAATVHLGGTLQEVALSESECWSGRVSSSPFVLLAQPSLFDPSRAPEGKHTAWGYCHVPNGFQGDVTERIEAQVERFAPNFRDTILAKRVSSPAALESWNSNLVGGDVGAGAMTI